MKRKRSLSILLIAAITVSAALSPATARPRNGSPCFEKGCKGSHCIFCER